MNWTALKLRASVNQKVLLREERGGERGGRGFRMRDTGTSMSDSCLCMATTTTTL